MSEQCISGHCVQPLVMTAVFQTLSGTLMKQFLDDFSEQAGEFFEEVMPQGALWKKKCNSK